METSGLGEVDYNSEFFSNLKMVKKMQESTDENQTQSNVRTYPEITALINSFYETVPGPVIGSFQKELKTPEQCEAFRKRIDDAQAIVETLEILRQSGNNVFTVEDLTSGKMTKKKLQNIAGPFGINISQNKAALIETLEGMPKSIEFTRTDRWTNPDELGMRGQNKFWARMGEARAAYETASGEAYLHKRQLENLAAREEATTAEDAPAAPELPA